MDWSGFQAYSPIPPPGFFHSPVVSSPQAHPYMWGPQDSEPKTGGSQKTLDETTRNGTTATDTTPPHATSHQTMTLMPMLAAGVPGVVAGPTTKYQLTVSSHNHRSISSWEIIAGAT